MHTLFTMLLLGLTICTADAMAQGRRIATFPYSQPFTWVTATTTAFPVADADGGEFTLDAGTTGWTAAIGSHGLNNSGGGGALRIQTTAGVNGGVAGFVWYGDLSGYCADSLTIAWSKVSNGTGTRVNDLRIGTNGGAGSTFADIPLSAVAGGAWPAFDNSAVAQSGTLRVKLPASLGGATDARIRIYSINTGGSGSQPRVVVDNLAITADGAPPSGVIDSIGEITNVSIGLRMAFGIGADSIIVVRGVGAPPSGIPADGVRYSAGQGLNGADTVVFAGPADGSAVRDTGLQPGTAYHYAAYGFRSCNARYSAVAATATARTTGACAGPPPGVRDARTIARNQTSASIGYGVGARTDSVLIIRRRDGPPAFVPTDGARYTPGQGLNGGDTVVYVGPPVSPVIVRGLGPETMYVFAIHALQSCNGAYSAIPALDTMRTAPRPAITAQPLAGTGCVGERRVFSVAADGPNLKYQWRKDGIDIPGASGGSYAIDSVALGNAGTYDVRVSSTDSVIGAAPASPAIVLRSEPARLVVNAPPAIAAAPSEQTACPGFPVTFSVRATGDGITYQWRRNGQPIPGASDPAISILATAGEDGAYYDVVVAGTCPPALERGARLHVNVPPAIAEGPRSGTVCPGTRAVLSVAATGTDLSYQWRRDGREIPGATRDSYRIDSMSARDAGVYDVVVTGACPPAIVSDAARLAMSMAPIIAVQPVDRTVDPGAGAAFSVGVYGSEALRYQWQKNGVDIPGATGPVYTIRESSSDDIAGYSCAVSNPCTPPMAVSNSAWLFVSGGASIVLAPRSGAICAGATHTLRTVARGAGLLFQWRKDGRVLAGEIRPDITIRNASPSDAGSYVCVVTSREGTSLTTEAATITVDAPPVIIRQPSDQEVCRGERATFEVTATGAGLTYQWRREGKAVSGARGGIYTIPATDEADTGAYDCLVSGSCGTPVVSRTAYLRTIPAPSITTQPEEQWVTAGKPATFQVVATGTNLSYEWRRNGLSIPGTNAPSYTIPRVSVDHAGIYDVLVRGCSGLLLSQGALLRVERVPGEVPSEDASRGDVLLTVTPNPLDGRGRIELRLPQGAPLHTVVGLRLYDLLGNPVEDLGDLEIVDGRGSAWINTRSLPSGAYYCRMDTPEWMGIRVVTVMR